LVEVMIAVSVLAIGVLAVFLLQASALRGSRSATITQEMSNIAQSELQLQREFSRHVMAPVSGESCRSVGTLVGFTCHVDVYPCDLASGTITCRNSSVTTAVARQVTVVVEGPGGARAEVSTVVR
jgi:hypothetical protein